MRTRTVDNSLGEGVFYDSASNAGVLRRLIATLIDFVVIALLYILIAMAFFFAWQIGAIQFHPLRVVLSTTFLVAVLYLTQLKSSRWRTLGYRITGIMIVNARGERPAFLQMAFRLFLWFYGPFTLLFDLIWVGIDSEQQSLRDGYAGTCVVRSGAKPIGAGSLHLSYYMANGFIFAYPRVVRPMVIDAEQV